MIKKLEDNTVLDKIVLLLTTKETTDSNDIPTAFYEECLADLRDYKLGKIQAVPYSEVKKVLIAPKKWLVTA